MPSPLGTLLHYLLQEEPNGAGGTLRVEPLALISARTNESCWKELAGGPRAGLPGC